MAASPCPQLLPCYPFIPCTEKVLLQDWYQDCLQHNTICPFTPLPQLPPTAPLLLTHPLHIKSSFARLVSRLLVAQHCLPLYPPAPLPPTTPLLPTHPLHRKSCLQRWVSRLFSAQRCLLPCPQLLPCSPTAPLPPTAPVLPTHPLLRTCCTCCGVHGTTLLQSKGDTTVSV